MRHAVLIRRIKETRSTRKANKLVKGPEPGAMRHRVGCVHKHLNHGTEEKQTKTTRASGKQWIEIMSQNLTTLLDLCNNVPRGICIKERLSQRRGTTASQRRDTKQHDKGRDGSKLLETLIQNITRLLKRFHGFASPCNQRTKRCCVCRDFTAARCDKQATKCAWLGRISKTARVTLKGNKTRDSAEIIKDTFRDQQGKGDTLQLTLQTWSWEYQKTWYRIQSGPDN